jgi:pimeloyl-ACP methyl ester carboxylesterase
VAAENDANPPAPNTIVLIHRLWMTPFSWEHWIDRYEARGFRVLAPAWPGTDGDIDGLRRDPSGIGRPGIREITGHYAAIVRGLDHPPIVMGHSFGGAFTQILLDQSDARIRRAGQERAKGASGFLLTRSRSQVWLRNRFTRMLPYTPWKGLIAGGVQKTVNAIALKDYPPIRQHAGAG